MSNNEYKKIINSEQNSREYLLSFINDVYDDAIIFKRDEQLQECIYWYELIMELFPFNNALQELSEEINNDKEEMDTEGTNIEEMNKEDEVINNIIYKWSEITDTELQNRIDTCKKMLSNGEITNKEIEQTIREIVGDANEGSDEKEILSLPELRSELTHRVKSESEHEHDYETKSKVRKSSPKVQLPQLTKNDIDNYIKQDELLQRAIKSAKFAISSINFEDIDSAITELNNATGLLQRYKEQNSNLTSKS